MKSFFLLSLACVFLILPRAADASYVCTCYVDNRSMGQGIVYMPGTIEVDTLNEANSACWSQKRATGSSCNRVQSSSSNTSLSSSDLSNNENETYDCISAPKGITNACFRAFPLGEKVEDEGYRGSARRQCVAEAVSVELVQECAKSFPLGGEIGLRAGCIWNASYTDDYSRPLRCKM